MEQDKILNLKFSSFSVLFRTVVEVVRKFLGANNNKKALSNKETQSYLKYMHKFYMKIDFITIEIIKESLFYNLYVHYQH